MTSLAAMSSRKTTEGLLSGLNETRGGCPTFSGIITFYTSYGRPSLPRGKSNSRDHSAHRDKAIVQFVTWFVHVRTWNSFAHRMIRCGFAGLLVITLVVAGPQLAHAAFECNDTGWEGTSELLEVARAVAGTERIKLVAELDYAGLTAEDSLLFLHPEVGLDEQSVSAFVQQGGRAAVLDDFGRSTSFAERFGITRVQAPTDPLETLRDNVHLSVGTPVEALGADGSLQRHPIVRDVDRVVLNHPTGLTNPGLTPILQLKTKSGSSVPIALTGVVGSNPSGRLLVMSDPSAFINLMIRYPGNLTLARSIIRYLTEDDGRAGKGRLFIVANRFAQSGRYSNSHGPLADAMGAVERALRDLQQGLPPAAMLAMAGAVVLVMIRWIARHLWRKPPHASPRFLRPIPLPAQAGWPGRAAVLIAPTTHAALLLVELREAFRLRLAQLISADASASNNALLAMVEARSALPPELIGSLRSLLAEVDAAERAVVARRRIRITSANLLRLLRMSLDILDHISHLERHHRESSPPGQ